MATEEMTEFDGTQVTDIDSLPEVIECVSQAQRFQSDQLSTQQYILRDIEEKLTKEQAVVTKLEEELKGYQRDLYGNEEKIVKATSNCNNFKKEINDLINQELALKGEYEKHQRGMGVDERLYDDYQTKMAKYEEQIAKFEKKLLAYQLLAKEKEHLQRLESERSEILKSLNDFSESYDNEPKEKINDEVKRLTIEKLKIEKQLQDEKAKLAAEKSTQRSLQQDINVLQKRNQAQLIRLRNQLKEVQARNHQWQEEASQLEKHLTHLQNMVPNNNEVEWST